MTDLPFPIDPPPTRPGDWALFLDIDGTLLNLALTPDQVVIPPDLPALLDRLTTRFSGALALISGRSLHGIDRPFPGTRDAAGTHGGEWRLGGLTAPDADACPEDIVREIADEAHRLPGVLVERKTHSIALHYGRAPSQGTAVLSLAQTILGATSAALRLLRGKSVIEIIPAGATKGGAIERFMTFAPYAGRLPVFIGDDVTDEDGFETVNRLGGLSVHVGDPSPPGGPPSTARFALNSPEAVRRWLADLDRSPENEVPHEQS